MKKILHPVTVFSLFFVCCSLGIPYIFLDQEKAEDIQIFPADHPVNLDISGSPVDPNSEAIKSAIGLNVGLHADFGSGTWEGLPIGIPFVVTGSDSPMVDIVYDEYGDESDPGPFPIPLNAPVEGDGYGDAHVLAVDVDNLMLYELYSAQASDGRWIAGSGAKYNLAVTEYRPMGWTSADAAGMAIFPLLVRYEEIKRGVIDHAIRFTLERDNIYEGFITPARHLVSGSVNSNQMPFGARMRLQQDFDISGFSATNQIILQAMKDYGLILADVGSDMYVSGAPDERWDNEDLHELDSVTVEYFDIVEMGHIFHSSDY